MNKINLLITVVILGTIISCNSSSNSSPFEREKTPEELRIELKAQEQNNPTQYVTVDSKMKDSIVQTREEGFFHSAEYGKDGSVIKGIIKNAASVAKFKDVVLTVSFYSATDTEIKSEDYVFYEFYEPNSSKPFSLHVHPPEAMKSFGTRIKTATPVN
jgi:hypothetical protein